MLPKIYIGNSEHFLAFLNSICFLLTLATARFFLSRSQISTASSETSEKKKMKRKWIIGGLCHTYDKLAIADNIQRFICRGKFR